MNRALPIAVVFALVCTAGILHGRWTGRWDSGNAAAEAAKRMDTLPMAAGDWVAESLPINPREKSIAQADGMISRRYTNRQTGQVVTLMLLCGRSGPISVHTPDVCFPGAGFREVGSPSQFSAGDSAGDRLWVRHFEREAPGSLPIRVYYGWNEGGAWQASENPRFAHGGKPVLFKLYVLRQLTSRSDGVDSDPAADLIRRILPQLRNVTEPSEKSA